MKVAIIGAGELGMSLAKVLKKKSEVFVWDIDPAKVRRMISLRETVADARVIFFAVPSFAMRPAAGKVLPYIDPTRTVFVSLAKGIERYSGCTMDQILEETLPRHGLWAVLGGPMLATELAKGMACAGVLGIPPSPSASEIVRTISKLFHDTNLRIEVSDDPRGVALSGVLKNIYAVVMGIAAGLHWGADETAWLAARSMVEMVSIGRRMGAREETVRGTAGFADFLATAYSDHSRNHRSGFALATGHIPPVKGEGLLSLGALLELLGPHATLYPVLTALADTVRHRRIAKGFFHDLFLRHGIVRP